VFWCRLSG